MKSSMQQGHPSLSQIQQAEYATRTLNSGVTRVSANKIFAALSSGNTLNSTAHSMRVHDRIRGVDGVLVGMEFEILTVATDSFTINAVLPNALLPTAGDLFDHMRPITPAFTTEGNQIVSVVPTYLTPVDQLDTSDEGDGVLAPNINAIPARSANALAVVASLAADTKKIQTFDDIGEYMALYGAADRSIFICFLPIAGGEVEVNIPLGTAIFLGAVKDSAIATDTRLIIQFLG